ncbi:ABC transporter ATP-binding protein/permease [Microcoleus sp. D2_18a_D3]|uniref:ABC transporter ATP-binding protein/permease n=1 Tax=Microcoleus sp. D2_18a_D3 TaxID=3055330 RepID=UPI002FD71DBE
MAFDANFTPLVCENKINYFPNMNLVEVDNVSKSFYKGFGANQILKDINLTVKENDFIVLRGKNGVGKSTLLNLILGLLRPSGGQIQLMGLPPDNSFSKIGLGVVLQDTQVPRKVKVKELVDLLRSYYPNPLSREELMNKVNLTYKEDAWATDLSGGQKQRLYFALALAGNPRLLILDEPTRNLDDKGYEEFWKQIKLCRQQGITILMVTNNKSDSDELDTLATRYITLEKLSESSDKSQLVEEFRMAAKSEEKLDAVAAPEPVINKSEPFNQNILAIIKNQLFFEILQFLRTPVFLLATLSLVAFVPLLQFIPDITEDFERQAIIYISGLILFTIVIERIGKRIAVERSEGWLKLLRTTPLPPIAYIVAKIGTALLLCTISLLLIFVLATWQLEITGDASSWLVIFICLILGIIPFAILGLAMGYLIDPRSADSILSLSLIVVPLTCGQIPISESKIVQNLMALSPFYHYRELVFWAAKVPPYNNQIFLHLLWLIWSLGVFGLIAIWSYQRDQEVQ